MNILSLFDGISCGRLAFERAGIPVDKYYSSEIDKYAIQVTQKNRPDTIQIGDVNAVNFAEYAGKIDIIIGGSPCQDLSIAKQNREGLRGKRSGLFWRYVDALAAIRPKWFLLENVASMRNEDRDAITETLKRIYPDTQCVMINSALVSAQQRKRYYWTNWYVEQPEDKGILLKDILETDGIGCRVIGRRTDENGIRHDDWDTKTKQRVEINKDPQKANCISTVSKDSMVAEPLVPFVESKLSDIEQKFGEIPTMFNPYNKQKITDKAPTQTAQCGSQTKSSTVLIVEPVNLETYFRNFGTKGKIIPPDAEKTQTLTASMGCGGGNTPLLAEPVKPNRVGGFYEQVTRWGIYDKNGTSPTLTASMGMGGGFVPMVSEPVEDQKETPDGVYSVQNKSIYLTKNGQKKGPYAINLPDGNYVIRKLTPIECERLQTLPDNWTAGISNSQRYKAIGNGWTVDVIAHILKQIPTGEEQPQKPRRETLYQLKLW